MNTGTVAIGANAVRSLKKLASTTVAYGCCRRHCARHCHRGCRRGCRR